jgi:hypothetical protein
MPYTVSPGLKDNASQSHPLTICLDNMTFGRTREEFPEASIAVLVAGLAAGKSLGSLQLDQNHISYEEVATIVMSLVGHCTLTKLGLAYNYEDLQQSHSALKTLLASQPSCKLTQLVLHLKRVKNVASLDLLNNGVQKSSSLQLLNLWNSNL